MVLIGILLAVLVPIFLVWMGITWFIGRAVGRSEAASIAANWSAVARTLGCRYLDANGTLEGALDGATFKVDRFTITASAAGTVGQSSRITYTRVVATAAAIPKAFALTIARAGLVGAVAKALGAEDIVVGQPSFDQAFRVRSNQPELVRRSLGPDLAALFLAVPSADVTVESGIVITTHGGVVVAPDLLVSMIRVSASLASAIAAAAMTASP